MKVKSKKLVSLVLVLTMCFTLIPTGVFAADRSVQQTQVEPPLNLITTGVSAKDAADGTISNMDPSIEYATDPSFTDATEAPQGTLENLQPGDYYVRYKASGNEPCSTAVKYVIADYNKVAVYFVIAEKDGPISVKSAILKKGSACRLPQYTPVNPDTVTIGWTKSPNGGIIDLLHEGDYVKVTEDIKFYAQIIYTLPIPDLSANEKTIARIYATGELMEGYARNPALWDQLLGYFDPLMPKGKLRPMTHYPTKQKLLAVMQSVSF